MCLAGWWGAGKDLVNWLGVPKGIPSSLVQESLSTVIETLRLPCPLKSSLFSGGAGNIHFTGLFSSKWLVLHSSFFPVGIPLSGRVIKSHQFTLLVSLICTSG